MLRAARNGVLLERPNTPPLWRPRKVYHAPMFDVLQSSYADVEHELNEMRKMHMNESVLFVAGDGLALMRMNHLLASKPDVFFDQTPFVVPVQGVWLARARAHSITYLYVMLYVCVHGYLTDTRYTMLYLFSQGSILMVSSM